MDPEDAGDPQEGRDAGVGGAGFDFLVSGAAHVGGEEHAFLGAVLSQACDSDAVADGAAFGVEPVVGVGKGGHSTNAWAKMIICQPGKPGLL